MGVCRPHAEVQAEISGSVVSFVVPASWMGIPASSGERCLSFVVWIGSQKRSSRTESGFSARVAVRCSDAAHPTEQKNDGGN
jgi:hypothetical protein